MKKNQALRLVFLLNKYSFFNKTCENIIVNLVSLCYNDIKEVANRPRKCGIGNPTNNKQLKKENFKMDSVLEIVRIKQVVKKRKAGYLLESIKSPEDAAKMAMKEIGDEDREVFLVFVLNVKMQVIAIHRCHVGSLSASVVHPREVMKAAILNNGSSIVVFHNHPSMVTTPSSEDIEVTKRLVEVGHIMGIELLDHIIIGGTSYLSLKEKGYI